MIPLISLVLAVIALCSIQLSYLLGGVYALDALGLLLIPSFVLFFQQTLLESKEKSREYLWAFGLLLVSMGVALTIRYQFDVATIDDGYHLSKIVAHSIRNSFETKWLYILESEKATFYYIDFIESVWGIFWRWIPWDFVIVLQQSLPLIVLWKQMVQFFEGENISREAGFLSLIVILSLQIFWCQLGSGYIDSTVGVLVAMALFLSYALLKGSPGHPPLTRVLGLGCLSALCLISKTSLLPLGFFTMAVTLWAMVRYLKPRDFIFILIPAAIGLTYLLFHHYHVLKMKGNPFYPIWASPVFGKEMQAYYECHPIYVFLREHHLNFKLVNILVSWILDYKYRSGLDPDPWVGGNGIVWTYTVIPVMILFLIRYFQERKFVRIQFSKEILILLVLMMYVLFFDLSHIARFMVGFYAFILSWCLAWTWNEMVKFENSKRWGRILICVGLIAALGSFYFGVTGHHGFRKKIFSPIFAQYYNFPYHINVH